jgi:hypothetical protein
MIPINEITKNNAFIATPTVAYHNNEEKARKL